MARAVLLFDGDCAFCSASADFLRRRVRPTAQLRPWQFTDLDALGLTAAECDEAVQWVGDGHHAAGAAAVAAALRSSTRPGWRLAGRLLAWPMLRGLAAVGYRWTARHRHQLPGGTPACAVPPAQHRYGE